MFKNNGMYTINNICFNLKTSLLISLLYLIFSIQAKAQVPFEKGVNLTNWFQVDDVREIQLRRYDLEDFEQIKSLGCDVIRLPVNLMAMTNGDPDYNIDPLFFTLLDSVVHWAEKTDLHLILDNHTFDPSENTSSQIGDFLLSVWPQIAYRYKNGYDQMYYEILNGTYRSTLDRHTVA